MQRDIQGEFDNIPTKVNTPDAVMVPEPDSNRQDHSLAQIAEVQEDEVMKEPLVEDEEVKIEEP